MTKIQLDQEAIITGEYSSIIIALLRKHNHLSLVKIILFAYIFKKQRYYRETIYTGQNTKDVVFKCISQMSGLFFDYCENQKYILQSIHLLLLNKDIEQKNEIISLNNNTLEVEMLENQFIELAIEESRKYSDRQIVKEIFRNV